MKHIKCFFLHATFVFIETSFGQPPRYYKDSLLRRTVLVLGMFFSFLFFAVTLAHLNPLSFPIGFLRLKTRYHRNDWGFRSVPFSCGGARYHCVPRCFSPSTALPSLRKSYHIIGSIRGSYVTRSLSRYFLHLMQSSDRPYRNRLRLVHGCVRSSLL